jgi:hypothetical protein
LTSSYVQSPSSDNGAVPETESFQVETFAAAPVMESTDINVQVQPALENEEVQLDQPVSDDYEEEQHLSDDDDDDEITLPNTNVVKEKDVSGADSPQTFTDSTSDQIDIKTFWPAFLDHLIHERLNIGSFLSLACPFHTSVDTIDLKFSPAYRFQYLEVTKKNVRDEIEQILNKFAKRALQLNITIESKPIENGQNTFIQSIGKIPSTIDDEIEREPIIHTILEVFDGEVLN